MNCSTCDTAMSRRKVEICRSVCGKEIIILDVPGMVCDTLGCNEMVLETPIAEKINRMLDDSNGEAIMYFHD